MHAFISTEGKEKKRLKNLPDPDLLINQPTQKVVLNRHRKFAFGSQLTIGLSWMFATCVACLYARLLWVCWKVTVIFVRHGESTWNEIFNKVITLRCVENFTSCGKWLCRSEPFFLGFLNN
jgi:hypothetical protein